MQIIRYVCIILITSQLYAAETNLPQYQELAESSTQTFSEWCTNLKKVLFDCKEPAESAIGQYRSVLLDILSFINQPLEQQTEKTVKGHLEYYLDEFNCHQLKKLSNSQTITDNDRQKINDYYTTTRGKIKKLSLVKKKQ